jgi:hypothetical protein
MRGRRRESSKKARRVGPKQEVAQWKNFDYLAHQHARKQEDLRLDARDCRSRKNARWNVRTRRILEYLISMSHCRRNQIPRKNPDELPAEYWKNL